MQQKTNFEDKIFGLLRILRFPEESAGVLTRAEHQLQVGSVCAVLVQSGVEVVLEVPLDEAVVPEVDSRRRCKTKRNSTRFGTPSTTQ